MVEAAAIHSRAGKSAMLLRIETIMFSQAPDLERRMNYERATRYANPAFNTKHF